MVPVLLLLLMTTTPHTTSAQLATTSKPFNCSWQFSHCKHCLRVKWTQSKLDYCCKHEGIGCNHGVVNPAPAPVGLGVATVVTPAPTPVGLGVATACDAMCTFAGKAASCSFRYQWGADHKYAGVADGCTKSREMVLAQCPSCSSCSLDASGCQLMASAISPAPMPALVPALPRAAPMEPISQSSCDALCTYLGRDASCAARIQYGATHRFAGQQDACKLAYASVTRQCAHCAGCSVASVKYMTHCVARQLASSRPYDCGAGLGNWMVGWSDKKKKWCCANEETGCMPSTPSTTSIAFGCKAGYGNWAMGWSDSKKQWCCEHEARGCVVDDVQNAREATEQAEVQAVAQVRSALGLTPSPLTIKKFATRGIMFQLNMGTDFPSKTSAFVWLLVGGLALFITIRVWDSVARSQQRLQEAEEGVNPAIPMGL